MHSERIYDGEVGVVLAVITNLTDIVDTFKVLPDMNRKYVPRSEHIFKRLQPVLEDQLFLGRSYDGLFDQFEIMLALSYADLRAGDTMQHIWGPPGRFWWKERDRIRNDPAYSKFVSHAKSRGSDWEPLKVGFFRGSAERFGQIADSYGEDLNRTALS